MWPDRILNPGSLTLESDALPTALQTALCGPATQQLTDRDALFPGSAPFTLS